MSETAKTETAKTPWHLWVVGVLGLLWNSYGAYDFTMSVTQGDAYYRANGMTAEQIAYFHATPAWMYVVWGVGTVGAVIATVLLLLRSRWAVEAFAASLAGFVLSLVYTYLLSHSSAMQSPVLSGVILAGCLFFLWYAWTMRKAGMLR